MSAHGHTLQVSEAAQPPVITTAGEALASLRGVAVGMAACGLPESAAEIAAAVALLDGQRRVDTVYIVSYPSGTISGVYSDRDAAEYDAGLVNDGREVEAWCLRHRGPTVGSADSEIDRLKRITSIPVEPQSLRA